MKDKMKKKTCSFLCPIRIDFANNGEAEQKKKLKMMRIKIINLIYLTLCECASMYLFRVVCVYQFRITHGSTTQKRTKIEVKSAQVAKIWHITNSTE